MIEGIKQNGCISSIWCCYHRCPSNLTRKLKQWAPTGVGTRGVLDLKAALYKEQQEALLAREDPSAAAARKSRRTAGIDVSQIARKNAGVEERDRRDKEQIKAIDHFAPSCKPASMIYKSCTKCRLFHCFSAVDTSRSLG